MAGLLDELGKKLAERWLTLLVLPGALYLAAIIAAATLGHTHPFTAGRLTDRLDHWTAAAHPRSLTGLTVVLLIAFLLAAAACGLAAQALGTLTERLWLAADWAGWPAPLRRLAAARTHRRRQRWDQATTDFRQAREQAAGALAQARLTGTTPPPPTGLAIARRRLSRIAAESPERPTWMGDRVNAVAVRLDRELDLDLGIVWPYLWLTAPDTARSEITAAREALGRATTLAGWGLLYLVAGALWWPGLLVALATLVTALRHARTVTDTYALLVEATVRLHAADLARDLGLDHTGPLTRQTGSALTSLLRHPGHHQGPGSSP